MADPHKIPIDPNGNLSTKTEGTDTWTYSWNAERQLTRVEKNGVEFGRLAYDPKGRRVEMVAGGVTTTYTYDRLNILREVRGQSTLKYVHGSAVDEPLAADDGSTLSYFNADSLGSIVKATTAAGVVALTRQYDTWGNPEAGTSMPGYAFTGREWDAATGLYYYRARYYDPQIGRFLAEDPLNTTSRRLTELNAYAYVANNPVTHRDPSGLAIWVCNRKAFTPIGPGNHAYYWDDRNGGCCGMYSTQKCKEGGPTVDCCRKVEGSDGREHVILKCCRTSADEGWWYPGSPLWEGNDCHTAVDECLTWNGMKNPGAPGGRVGRPCDSRPTGASGGSH